MAAIGGFKFFKHLEYICVNTVSEFCVMKPNITEDMAVLHQENVKRLKKSFLSLEILEIVF